MLGPVGNIPPVELDAAYFQEKDVRAMIAGIALHVCEGTSRVKQLCPRD